MSKIKSESKKKTKSPILDELSEANKSCVKPLEGFLGKLEGLKEGDGKIDSKAIMGELTQVSLVA